LNELVPRVSDVRQIGVHTTEPLVTDPRPFDVEIGVAKLKSYKSPGSYQVPSELIQSGDEIIRFEIHKLINYVCNKEELTDR
jgi:hypothetical protein